MFLYGVFMLYNGERTLERLFNNKHRAEYFKSNQEDFDKDRGFDENRTYYLEELYVDMRGE